MQQEIAALIELQKHSAPISIDASTSGDLTSGFGQLVKETDGGVNDLAPLLDDVVLARLGSDPAPSPALQRAGNAMLALLGFQDSSWDAARQEMQSAGLKERLLSASEPGMILKLPTPLLRRVAAFAENPSSRLTQQKRGNKDAGAFYKFLRAAARAASECPQLNVSVEESRAATKGRRELSGAATRRSALRSRLPRPAAEHLSPFGSMWMEAEGRSGTGTSSFHSTLLPPVGQRPGYTSAHSCMAP